MSSNMLPAGTQITLAFSARTGIVAVTTGTRYQEAATLLVTAGFTRREDGTSTLATADAGTARRALTDLTRLAADQDMTLTASSRVWLGDTTDRIAAGLPGVWRSRIEVYAMPVWQQDLDGCLWDSGGLIDAVRSERIPFGSVLTDARGTQLFVVDKPGTDGELLVGALAPGGLDQPFAGDPAAPPSLTVPADPALAAQAITTALLPAYHQAVHQRRVEEVGDRLDRALSAEIARVLVRGTWPPDDGTGLGAVILGRLEHAHHEALWDDFRSFLLHGPHLLDHLDTVAARLRPAEQPVLPALREALRHGRRVHSEWLDTVRRVREGDNALAGTTYAQAAAQRTADARPALTAWLEHGPALVDLAHRHPPTAGRPATPRALPPAPLGGPPGKHRGTIS
ncbi:hypothetical protein V2S66_18845 [Streptomyces sp. V4-01]|uniref:Uncharacterized protein n=1 Tax=Actinacidiphila polyblastidii TaxID=3110430 RepID=A0ABU7PE00_9ACTN|nr:hypothetical protein [Streptomyces sp. V4-01]